MSHNITNELSAKTNSHILSGENELTDDDEFENLITIADYSDSENVPESDEGNHEYKYSLGNLTDEQFDHYSVQMQYRLTEGQGQAFYTLGIRDDGYPIGLSKEHLDMSLKSLFELAKTNSAMICYVQQKKVPNRYKKNIPVRKSGGQERHDNLEIMEHRLDHITISDKKTRKLEKKAAKLAESNISDTPAAISDSDKVSESDIKLPESLDRELKELYIANILIRKVSKDSYVDLKIGVAGNVDSSKSTTIGVLTRGQLDNGRGSARASVFNHKHELESGRTSSISQQIMGFNKDGQSVNDLMGKIHAPSWDEIVANSNKVITFFDLAGHEKYLKTTIIGLSTHKPDYCLILVGANMGYTHMTTEHINLCLTYKIPFIVLLTKIDLAPPKILQKTQEDISRILKERGRATYIIKNTDDMIKLSQELKDDVIVPIIETSNVKGTNIQLLKDFLNLLPKKRDDMHLRTEPVKYLVHESFTVKGTGTVVSGYMAQGTVNVGDRLLLGPDSTNKFIQTQIKSIHSKKVNVLTAYAGQNVCFSLRNINRTDIRKGMVLLATNYVPQLSSEQTVTPLKKSLPDGELHGYMEFEAEVVILKNHSTCIRNGYSPIIHVDNARQAAQIMQILNVQFNSKRVEQGSFNQPITTDESGTPIFVKGRLPKKHRTLSSLRAGDRATVLFRFCYKPEFIEAGGKLLFREGTTRGIGKIKSIINR